MSMNPSYEPYNPNNANRLPNQNEIDQQYVQQVGGQPRIYSGPQPTMQYNAQPVMPVNSHPVNEVNRTITNTPVQVNVPVQHSLKDAVRWGPILAGLFAALATL